ncbi:hypothetical protein GCM10022198_09270 [Klugiella xanthotipulae]|uniref:Lipoprotein n=1 Tax=Klugiella xanthotipulae TaxID=244735 RepID=A0A543I624_9MICO|nr:hypothetical protein [Klugiella xanthotipulae]TQM66056.1 hypothetical protein FB466_0878 [Klugiella xanthotipulae]
MTHTTRTNRGLLRGALTLAGLGLTLTGCTGTGDPAHPITLVVRDAALREIGADCAGATPYNYVHAGTELRFLTAEGTLADSHTLSPGVAVAADDRDYGEATRVPSLCRFTVDGSALTAGTTYTLSFGDRKSQDFTYQPGETAEADPVIALPPLGDPTTEDTD